MSKFLSIFLCFLIFAMLEIFPPVGAPGLIGDAHAVMGGSLNITVKKRFHGEIGEVDQDTKTITVVRKIGDREYKVNFTFTDNTTVNSGKERKTVGDLKSGDKVVVEYVKTDGGNVADNIVVEK